MGVYISITVWLLSFQFLHNWIFEMPYRYYLLALSCLIPGGCIHWAVFILSESKSNTWEAAFAPYYTPLPPAPALWHIFVMMGVDILWYFFATLYIDNLTTGLHGQPWNYFFEVSMAPFFLHIMCCKLIQRQMVCTELPLPMFQPTKHTWPSRSIVAIRTTCRCLRERLQKVLLD